MNLVYLKPNLVIEPLIDNWYAWAHLISPGTYAKNITGRHLKIMNSYIKAPHIHDAAVKNPKMKGGPFMDLPGNRVKEVTELKEHTLSKRKKLVELSDAISELEKLLQEKGKGYSLEPLYEEVPELLDGLVELFYDLNNQPSYRFFEHLLYDEFYDPSTQSILLWLTDNDERPFCLSTPRINVGNEIQLNIPFSSPLIDKLARMKRTPGSLEEIMQDLSIPDKNRELFESFFTPDPPKPYQKYESDKVRMRYFGHACILIETPEVSILVDPIISYYGYPVEVDRFSDFHLPETIDYVLITHNHQDHILFETLLPLRHKIKQIIVPKTYNGGLQDPSLKMTLEKTGFNQVVEIGEFESIEYEDCKILGLPFVGEHSDLNVQAKICHHIQIGELTMLFAADSCNVAPKLYERVHRLIGDVDVMFLGMECDGAPLSWLYGPLMPEELPRDMDQTRRLAGSNYDRAKAMVEVFNPEELYVYAMGQEPWLEFISSIKYTEESHPIIASNKLLDFCRSKRIATERLFGEKELLYNRASVGELH